MVALHTGFLAAMLVEALVRRPDVPGALAWSMLALVIAAQALRWWCIVDARPPLEHPGDRGARACAPVTRGPTAVLAHPNYVAVVVEGVGAAAGARVPGSPRSASPSLNAALLTVRIRVENAGARHAPLPRRVR